MEISDHGMHQTQNTEAMSFLKSLGFPDYPADSLAYRGGYTRCGDNIARISDSFDLEALLKDHPEVGTWIIDEASFYDEPLVYVVRNESESLKNDIPRSKLYESLKELSNGDKERRNAMRITEIIEKKKRKQELTKEEIEFFIDGYVDETVPDYQIAALLMAIWFNGMDNRETTDLTLTMARSGDQVDLSKIPGTKADKHSTGGVADTTTLITAPLVAACGGTVAKMSGRGLGHSGGTLDKLESIPGFQVFQPMDRFIEIVNTHGLSVVGQTANLVPADKKLYALRDVTGTVDNVSLIASSIMSKKIAAGSDVIVLDVKVGSGAFIKELAEARRLAESMVAIGNRAGRKTVAVVTNMDQPLGNAVGNALEVQEAIEILQGKYEGDLKTVAVELAARMLVLSDIVSDREEGTALCRQALREGRALKKLRVMIEAQGGDPAVTDNPSLLPKASRRMTVTASSSGWISAIDTEAVGLAAMSLGAGRLKKEDEIDPAVGIWMKKRLGDEVGDGEPLAVFHVNDERKLDDALTIFKNAITITPGPPAERELIHAYIE